MARMVGAKQLFFGGGTPQNFSRSINTVATVGSNGSIRDYRYSFSTKKICIVPGCWVHAHLPALNSLRGVLLHETDGVSSRKLATNTPTGTVSCSLHNHVAMISNYKLIIFISFHYRYVLVFYMNSMLCIVSLLIYEDFSASHSPESGDDDDAGG